MDTKLGNRDIENTIDKYSNMLYRTCFLMLRNKQDAEDVMQETFISYMTSNMAFVSEEHKKAWLLRVSQNKCKNILRFHKAHAHTSYEELEETLPANAKVLEEDVNELFRIAELSYNLKSVVMMYYIEGYSVKETAEILGIKTSAVKMRLKRAREILKITYEKIFEMGVN